MKKLRYLSYILMMALFFGFSACGGGSGAEGEGLPADLPSGELPDAGDELSIEGLDGGQIDPAASIVVSFKKAVIEASVSPSSLFVVSSEVVAAASPGVKSQGVVSDVESNLARNILLAISDDECNAANALNDSVNKIDDASYEIPFEAEHGAQYTLCVMGVEAEDGEVFNGKKSFETTADPDADALSPSVLLAKVSPAANSEVYPSAVSKIVIPFSERMDRKTVNSSSISVRDGDGKAVSGQVIYEEYAISRKGEKIWTARALFVPQAAPSSGTTFAVSVNELATDLAGNALVPGSWSFKTKAGQTWPPCKGVACIAYLGGSCNPVMIGDGDDPMVYVGLGKSYSGADLISLFKASAEEIAAPVACFILNAAEEEKSAILSGCLTLESILNSFEMCMGEGGDDDEGGGGCEGNAPSAEGDTLELYGSGSGVIYVLSNDSYDSINELQVEIISNPDCGTVTQHFDREGDPVKGSYSYTHDGCQGDSFTYQISDDCGSSQATVTVIPGAAPAEPVLGVSTNSISLVCQKDDACDVGFFSISNSGGGTLTWEIRCPEGPNNPICNNLWMSSLSGTNDAEVSMDPRIGSSDSGEYTAQLLVSAYNGEWQQIEGATVGLTVLVNNPPIAQDLEVNVVVNGSVDINVFDLGAVVDPDGHGWIVSALGVGTSGSVEYLNSLSFRYTNTSGQPGTDTFKYWVQDEYGGSGDATVTVNITTDNSKPFYMENSEYTVTSLEEYSVPAPGVLTNWSDSDKGDVLCVIPYSESAWNGSIIMSTNGAFTYTPDGESKSGQDPIVMTPGIAVCDRANLCDEGIFDTDHCTRGSFTIILDVVPPTAGLEVPSVENLGAVLVSSKIQVSFSENMDSDSINGDTFILIEADSEGNPVGDPVAAAIGCMEGAEDCVRAELVPSADLKPLTNYMIVLNNGKIDGAPPYAMQDVAGNSLAQAYMWTFMTEVNWMALGDPLGFGNAAYISLALGADDTPHIAYTSGGDVIVGRYSGGVWDTWNVGYDGQEAIWTTAILVDSTGAVYLALKDASLDRVYKCEEKSCVEILSGTNSFAGLAIAIDSQDRLYYARAYISGGQGYISVQRYDDGIIDELGPVHPGYAYNVRLAVGPDDKVYLISSNMNAGEPYYGNWPLDVRVYDEVMETWSFIRGNPDNTLWPLTAFPSSEGIEDVNKAWEPSPAFDSEGNLYLAFKFLENIRLIKYDALSESWSLVLEDIVDVPYLIQAPSLALASNDVPYVSFYYHDGSNYRKNVAMVDGGSWSLVNDSLITEYTQHNMNFAIDSSDQLYLGVGRAGDPAGNIKVMMYPAIKKK